MRYQQKQMQENAQKKSELFDETQKLLTSSLGAGKVSYCDESDWRRRHCEVFSCTWTDFKIPHIFMTLSELLMTFCDTR